MKVLLLLLSDTICLSLQAAASPLNHSSIIPRLTSLAGGFSPGTQIFYPSDANWLTETTQRYTVHDAPTYIASIRPAEESDVQKIVKFASALGVPFLATGGGHGFATTFGALENGLELDLSFFHNVTLDTATSTMTIGGAVIFRDIYDVLYDAGKEIPTGSSGCVGMLGATLGGGVGRYNGLHGMILDSLLSVRMVTASGDIVIASTTENADLFWGIRGAGFNYGIVVSAEYQVYNLTSSLVMSADMVFPVNQNATIFNYLKTYETSLPAEFAIILLGGFNEAYGGHYILINAAYAGPLSSGIALIQPLLDLRPIKQNISEIPWSELTETAFFDAEGSLPNPCIKDLNQNVYGGSIKTYDIPTFQTWVAELDSFYNDYPNARGSTWFIEHFATQAVRAVPDEATAYPWRDITAHLLFNYAYNDTTLEASVNAFAQKARARFNATSGFDGLQIYVNYGHGDEGLEPLYGNSKLPRLQALKRQWDPQNLFRFNEGL